MQSKQIAEALTRNLEDAQARLLCVHLHACTQKPKVNLPFRQVFQLTLPKGSLNLSNFL